MSIKHKHVLPTYYNRLTRAEKAEVRGQYISNQGGLCWRCGVDLNYDPPEEITSRPINWKLFPGGKKFLMYPVHLQHDHKTGLTEGAVHAHCNAYMWCYEGR